MDYSVQAMTMHDYDELYALWTRTPDGTLLGGILCGHDGRRGHIYHTAVDASARGNGIGRALVERLRARLPEAEVLAVGANAIATSAMLKAGASAAATGENAVRVCAKTADVIAGPIGIVLKDAMMGEITGAMAAAVAESPAKRVLVPVQRCDTRIAGADGAPLQALLDDAVRQIAELKA